jgi:superfamily II DNA or RNA helicase
MTEVSGNSLSITLPPRRWQIEALQNWKGEYRGVVSVVTGGGKTIFGELCILAFLEKFPNGRIVIITPTIMLLDQWYVSLIEDLHAHADQISLFSGETKSKDLRLFNIFVINTARELSKYLSTNFPVMLILDECHHAGSPENSKSLNFPYTATLGLSATPEREYDNAFNLIVSPKLGNIIYRYDYKQAYIDKVICPFDLINVRIPFLNDEQEIYDQYSKRIGIEYKRILDHKGDENKLRILLQKRAAISAMARMRIPVTIKIINQYINLRTIVFHERINQAEKIHEILLREKYGATIYHSKVPPIIRRDNLMLFRKGVYEIIVTCRALDEGMNVPETNVGIISSSSASYRQRIQRLGRLLRPSKDKKNARIYTLYATDQEENRLISEAKTLSEIASISWVKSSV